MDDPSFGPMTSAEGVINGEPDSHSVEEELQFYRKQAEALQKQRTEDEKSFGLKRAQFMEIYSKKEEELKQIKSNLQAAVTERQTLQTELDRLKTELDDIKTATAISETGRDDYVQMLKRQHDEEVASMRHIMEERLSVMEESATAKLKEESGRYQQVIKKLEAEITDHKEKLSQLNLDGGVLSSVVKSISKKVGTPLMTREMEEENLEESMKKAQENTNLLKSVVLPLEAEVAALKEHVHDCQLRLQKYEPDTEVSIIPSAQTAADASSSEQMGALEEKVRELQKSLETEKSSRSDLEMYVAVLSAQIDKLRNDLTESNNSLTTEKREHNALKETWSMANDQFLESQRLLMMDLTRMEGLLTGEQHKTLNELKQADAHREAQEQKVRELEEKCREEETKLNKRPTGEQAQSGLEKVTGSLTSLASDDLAKLDSGDEGFIRRSHSSHSMDRDTPDGHVLSDTRSLSGEPVSEGLGFEPSSNRSSPDKSQASARTVHSLNKAQLQSIAETNFDFRLSESVLAGVKAKSEQFNLTGKRLVSDKEWSMLQKEMVAARERLGKPCDMCRNYESQLQQLQAEGRKGEAQVQNLERQLENERTTLKSLQEYVSSLETQLKDIALQFQNQLSEFESEMRRKEAVVSDTQAESVNVHEQLKEELVRLTEGREQLQQELMKLEKENNDLVGKHSKHSQQLQEETINLPENLEDMQLLLLKYREDIIAAKVAKEHSDERLRSELLFNKDQYDSELQIINSEVEELNSEIRQLQEENTILQSVKSELERQTKLKQEAEARAVTSEQQLSSTQAKSKQLLHALQGQVTELNATRSKLEGELQERKMKVQNLQRDLDNSVETQRDFVKLSKSLQIQLEQIRSSASELRWEHEEDVEQCNNCHRSFQGQHKRKNHCRHCGKIFCIDCVSKTVKSGPNGRPSRVCDVCHTILVQDATPYFSLEPPNTPD